MYTTSEEAVIETGRYTDHGHGAVQYHLVNDELGGKTGGTIDLFALGGGAALVVNVDSAESGNVVISGSGTLSTKNSSRTLGRGSVFQTQGTGSYTLQADDDTDLRILRFASASMTGSATSADPVMRSFELAEAEDLPFHLPEQGFHHLSARWLVDADRGGAENFTLGQSTFDSERGVHELHRHPAAEEVFFVWEGEGVHLTENGGEVPVKSGDLIFVPRNEWHGFRNTGSIPVRAVFGYLGAGSLDAGGYELPVAQTH